MGHLVSSLQHNGLSVDSPLKELEDEDVMMHGPDNPNDGYFVDGLEDRSDTGNRDEEGKENKEGEEGEEGEEEEEEEEEEGDNDNEDNVDMWNETSDHWHLGHG